LASLHYVLGLWERLIQSVPYMKNERPHNLELFCPQILDAYIKVSADALALQPEQPDTARCRGPLGTGAGMVPVAPVSGRAGAARGN
jgi:hypothetical protein